MQVHQFCFRFDSLGDKDKTKHQMNMLSVSSRPLISTFCIKISMQGCDQMLHVFSTEPLGMHVYQFGFQRGPSNSHGMLHLQKLLAGCQEGNDEGQDPATLPSPSLLPDSVTNSGYVVLPLIATSGSCNLITTSILLMRLHLVEESSLSLRFCYKCRPQIPWSSRV